MKRILLFIIVLIGTFFLWQLTKKPEEIIFQNQNEKDEPNLTIIAEGLDTPWAIAFLPDNSILLTERQGRVRLIENAKLQDEPIAIINNARELGEGGLLGITLHPNFSTNSYVYLYYTYSGDDGETLNRVVRMVYKNRQIKNEEIIVDRIPGASNHNGGRIKFGPDGFLYITTGDTGISSQSQNLDSLAGKILRVTDDGNKVPENPFDNLIYSYGHRNPQGLTWDSKARLFITEHGPSAQDELNLVEIGKNYGWPESVGDNIKTGTIAPLIHSGRETWAPAGAVFIDNFLFFSGLRGQSLYKITLEGNKIKKLDKYFENEFGRIREVIAGPNNMLYLSTSNRDGRGNPSNTDDKIIKINPNSL